MGINIHLFIFILITSFYFFTSLIPNKKVSKIIFIMCVTITIFFVQGLRSVDVGADTFTYLRYFNYLDNATFSTLNHSIFEIGYQFTAYIANSIGITFQMFIGIISLFNLLILGFFIYKYSSYPFISYIFYMIMGMYDFGFSGLRQSIAMSIVLLSFEFIYNKKIMLFILSIIIASLFHNSAIIFLIIYPLINHERVSFYYKKTYFIILLLVFISSGQIVNLVTSFYNEEYLSYVNLNFSIGLADFIIFLIFLIGYTLRKYSLGNDKDRLYNSLLIIASFSLLLQILSSQSYMFARLNLYLYHFIIVLIPIMFEKLILHISFQNKEQRILFKYFMLMLFVVITFTYFNYYLRGNPHQILPHSFLW